MLPLMYRGLPMDERVRRAREMLKLVGLENFETIEMLDLKYAHNLSDLSPILNLPNLKELTISSDMAWMEYQLEGRQFELNYRDDR